MQNLADKIPRAIEHLPTDSEMIGAIDATMALAKVSHSCEDFSARFYPQLLQPWPHRHEGRSIAVDPRESVPPAFGCLYIADGDPRETILTCANFGRDADTIAMMAGAIAGAWRGYAALPDDWANGMCAASPVNQHQLAQDLLGVFERRISATPANEQPSNLQTSQHDTPI